MRAFIRRFHSDDSGATAIEYGLIAALIFLTIIGAVTAFGEAVTEVFNTAMTRLAEVIAGV